MSYVTIPDHAAKARSKFSREVSKRLKKHPRTEQLECDLFDAFVVRDFMSASECMQMMRMIDKTAQPSTLYETDPDREFRTSYSGNVDPHDPFIKMIDGRICKLLGIKPARGETIQGQRYDVGQQFKPHQDYFHVTEPYWQQEKPRGGQRTWTAMIYLNEPVEGGETGFTTAGFMVPPYTGMLLTWNNLKADGTVNPDTMHSGNPVIAGTKYIVTKWFREGIWK